jgi:hypothetical protein
MNDLKLYFSMISGDMYYIEPDEVKNLDKSQIPLTKKPRGNCNRCYGRFHIGFETKKKYYIPCPKCMKKCVDWDALTEDPVVEAPITTSEIADHEFIKAAEESGIQGE